MLREHHAVGRLTAAEFHDRLDAALEATTLGELDELLGDLPAIDLYELPDATLRRGRGGELARSGTTGLPWDSPVAKDAEGDGSPALSAGATALIAWGTVALTLVAIALVTGILVGGLSAWLVLAAIPAGAIFLIRFLIRRSRH
jgi:hypothetical protein